MVVTATEFKTNFGIYLDMLLSEDIFITNMAQELLQRAFQKIDRFISLGMTSYHLMGQQL